MIDLLLYLIYGMLALAAMLTTWSTLRSLVRNRGEAVEWGIPVRLIGWLIVAGLLVVLVLTFVLGDASPLAINGRTYADGLWLRVADMLINTSIVLIIVAALGVLFGVSGLSRKLKR
ncbi:MAG: hypothetical protein IJV36_06020 [Prevotella sp.]|nr:hypothetical protein [Prevotella sp.]